jgi:peptide chain release factor 2
MENLLKKIEDLREKFLKTRTLLDIDAQITESREQKRLMSEPDFWNDQNKAVAVGRRVEELDSEINKWEAFGQEIRELEELAALAEKENDDSMHDDVEKKFIDLEKKFNQFEFLMMFDGHYDQSNAIVSVHSGTGGVDAQDFAQMLERMLLRFAENKNFKTEILDRNLGNEAGIKSTTFRVTGMWAYGYFKVASGVHRLIRISPFDAESMRHTSFALVEVIPELPDTEDVVIAEGDLKMDFFHSSGPGGQNVNKTSSAVRLTHLPTKIVVACQSERSQHQNREIALRILKAKLKLLEDEKREVAEKKLKGNIKSATWGKQIMTYTLQPYQLVKDHRTDHETSEVNKVLEGALDEFAESYLRWLKK